MSTLFGAQNRYEIAAQEDRSAPRTRISIPATLRASGSKGFQTVVHDLSLSGFSAMAINRLHTGTLCWLTLPGLESMQGEVIWWDNSQVGCAFHQLLSPIIYENILAQWQKDPIYRMVP
jgi:PilZ domain